jgi:hypothetical protein
MDIADTAPPAFVKAITSVPLLRTFFGLVLVVPMCDTYLLLYFSRALPHVNNA